MPKKTDGIGAEASLIRRLQCGDPGAFDELFEKHRRGLRAYVYGMTRDNGVAEDVTQECFIRLVRDIQKIKPKKGASSWLYRVARNLTIDMLRRRKFEVLPGKEFFDDERKHGRTGRAEAPDERAIAREDKKGMEAMLETLTQKERDVVVLRFYGDLTFREIAEVVKRPLGTVLWESRKALEKLSKTIKGTDHER